MTKPKIKNEQLAAVLSYFLIGIIWYAVDKNIRKSNFVKFHVKQSLNLTLISIIANLSAYTLLLAFIAFPVNLPPMTAIILMITITIITGIISPIFFAVLSIIGFLNVLKQKQKNIPIIGVLAEKYLKF